MVARATKQSSNRADVSEKKSWKVREEGVVTHYGDRSVSRRYSLWTQLERD